MKCWVPLPERFPWWRELGQCIWPLPQSSAEKPQQTVEAMGLRAVRRGLLGNSSLGCLYRELDVEELRWDVAWDTAKAVLSDFGIKQHFAMLSLCPSKNKGPSERTRDRKVRTCAENPSCSMWWWSPGAVLAGCEETRAEGVAEGAGSGEGLWRSRKWSLKEPEGIPEGAGSGLWRSRKGSLKEPKVGSLKEPEVGSLKDPEGVSEGAGPATGRAGPTRRPSGEQLDARRDSVDSFLDASIGITLLEICITV